MRGTWLAVVMAGAVLLEGCRTGGPVAQRLRARDGSIARAPRFEEGRDFVLTGTVDADYADYLVIRSRSDHVRYLRIQESTRYYQGGRLIPREYLSPGSRVRASFSLNDKETVASEVYVLEDAGGPDPLVWPERIKPVPW